MRRLVRVIPVFLLLLASALGAAAAHAQGASTPSAPTGVRVANGPNPGEATLDWNAVSEAEFYRVGWLAVPDYIVHQDNDAW